MYLNAETPIVTIVESTHFSINDLPFPAVTICSFNKISKSKANVLAAQLKSLPTRNVSHSDWIKKLKYLGAVLGHNKENGPRFMELHRAFIYNNLSLSAVMDRLAPECKDIVEKCMYIIYKYGVSEVLRLSRGSKGLQSS